jgi:uncharacterized membrane protein
MDQATENQNRHSRLALCIRRYQPTWMAPITDWLSTPYLGLRYQQQYYIMRFNLKLIIALIWIIIGAGLLFGMAPKQGLQRIIAMLYLATNAVISSYITYRGMQRRLPSLQDIMDDSQRETRYQDLSTKTHAVVSMGLAILGLVTIALGIYQAVEKPKIWDVITAYILVGLRTLYLAYAWAKIVRQEHLQHALDVRPIVPVELVLASP